MNKIGTIIRDRRKYLKITQLELAELSGVGINTVVAIERGSGNPRISTVLQILETLGLEISIVLRTLP